MNEELFDDLVDYSDIDNDQDDIDIPLQSISSAVVSSNDWTTETIIRQIEKGNILLDPDFQRRDAWTLKKKSQFIESLILGLPIPQIVLAEVKEKKGKYIVLDGKQRLLSLKQFSSIENSENSKNLTLSGLEVKKNLNHITYKELSENPIFDSELSSFENQPIRTVVIKNWPNDDFLYLVFLRLNTGSLPLSPQELRQALHPGEFINFLNKESINSTELKEILGLPPSKADFRMRDTELLLRYFAFKNFIDAYTGNLKKFLDETCQKFNSEWANKKYIIEQQLELFKKSHERIVEIFDTNSYRKWNGTTYENRFNRAIYDLMIVTFSDENVLNYTKDRDTQIKIKEAFEELCSKNPDFLKSIETTTKSISATEIKFNQWRSSLNALLKLNLDSINLRMQK